MSDMSQGPGWWIASDGKWYPPHLHPSVRVDPPMSEDHTPAATSEETLGTTSVQASEIPASEIRGRFVGSPGTGPAIGVDQASDLTPTALSTKRHSRGPLAAALSVLVVILLVAGALVVFGGSKSASAEVIDAVNSSLGDKTAQITMNETITTAGKTLTAKGTGGMDFTHEAVQIELNATVDGQQIPVEVEYVGGVIYEKVPGLDQLVPGKSWLSIDVSSLQSSSTPQDPSAQSVGENPTVMLRMLAQQGNKVVALGPSTRDGVAVNGYAVTVDASTVSQELRKASLPSWMRRSLIGLKSQNINLKVYVDNSDLLRSFEFQTTESKVSTGPIDINETLGFSKYGTAVSVSAPTADQVASYEQVLQAEQAQAQSAPAS
ncbi:MAG TPA: hypothetical protein VNC61_11815 [Acidimicrobiales bacterium]|nr:hypothetical protein [Acidimicrobiales bacterium]